MSEYIFTLGDPVFNEETREAVFRPEVVGRLIRCRDCKHGLKVVSPITGIFCTRFGAKDMAVEDDDYCSYGERGEADDE